MNVQSTFYRLHTQEWTPRVMMKRSERRLGGRKLRLRWVIEGMLLMVCLFLFRDRGMCADWIEDDLVDPNDVASDSD
jgi:hypothetical protein